MKNVTVTVGFAVITVSQFALGMYMLALVTRKKGKDKHWT